MPFSPEWLQQSLTASSVDKAVGRLESSAGAHDCMIGRTVGKMAQQELSEQNQQEQDPGPRAVQPGSLAHLQREGDRRPGAAQTGLPGSWGSAQRRWRGRRGLPCLSLMGIKMGTYGASSSALSSWSSGSAPCTQCTSSHSAQCLCVGITNLFSHDTLKMAVLLIVTTPGRSHSNLLGCSGQMCRSEGP